MARCSHLLQGAEALTQTCRLASKRVFQGPEAIRHAYNLANLRCYGGVCVHGHEQVVDDFNSSCRQTACLFIILNNPS